MQLNIKEIADGADMIINGYAFTKDSEKVRVLNQREVRKIRAFIKTHYREMYLKWLEIEDTGFYGDK
ncbi:MAG: hypothetical protein ACI4DO_08985 [Roseburia sp.]